MRAVVTYRDETTAEGDESLWRSVWDNELPEAWYAALYDGEEIVCEWTLGGQARYIRNSTTNGVDPFPVFDMPIE